MCSPPLPSASPRIYISLFKRTVDAPHQVSAADRKDSAKSKQELRTERKLKRKDKKASVHACCSRPREA